MWFHRSFCCLLFLDADESVLAADAGNDSTRPPLVDAESSDFHLL